MGGVPDEERLVRDAELTNRFRQEVCNRAWQPAAVPITACTSQACGVWNGAFTDDHHGLAAGDARRIDRALEPHTQARESHCVGHGPAGPRSHWLSPRAYRELRAASAHRGDASPGGAG